jgi:hypothetical protein
MLVIAGAVGRQNHSENKDGVDEQVNGSTSDDESEGQQDQIRETLSKCRHDRKVEQILFVLSLLDGVFVLEERDDGSEGRNGALSEACD